MPLRPHIAAVFMASTTENLGQWVIELGRKRAGILFTVALILGAYGLGASTVLFVSDFRTWGERIATLESTFANHVEEVTEPSLERLDRLEYRQDQFRRQWEREWDLEAGGRLAIVAEQTHQMYCDRWPDRCRPVPR